MIDPLSDIAKRYPTDKADHPGYLLNYEKYLGGYRDLEVRLLELGVRDGGSLLMWRDYFHKGVIAGLDIIPVNIRDNTGRVHFYEGSQADPQVLDRIAEECAPQGFDVIIDDCSHIGILARASFEHLFHRHLKNGGIYVIEDWGSGYWDDWPDGVRYVQVKLRRADILDRVGYRIATLIRGGNRSKLLSYLKRTIVERRSASHNAGMVGFLKEIVDKIAVEDIRRGQYRAVEGECSTIREIHISPSHAFVVKA